MHQVKLIAQRNKGLDGVRHRIPSLTGDLSGRNSLDTCPQIKIQDRFALGNPTLVTRTVFDAHSICVAASALVTESNLAIANSRVLKYLYVIQRWGEVTTGELHGQALAAVRLCVAPK